MKKLLGRSRAWEPKPIHYEDWAPRRALFYCASNIGLGHMGRLARIIGRLRDLAPEAGFLMATDAKDLGLAAQAGDMGIMRLPSFAFDESGRFQDVPQGLGIDKRQLQALRQNALLSLVESYQPHVLCMDTLPHGKRDEMLPALRLLARRRPKCHTVLCMRDIPCPPDEKFKLSGSTPKLEKHAAPYDHLLAAGDPKFFDWAKAYQWPDWLAKRLRYIGFVVPQIEAKSDADRATKELVASFGGGWESASLSTELIRAIREVRRRGRVRVRLSLFTGPAIGDTDFAELQKQADGDPSLQVARFSPEFPRILAGADLAFLQAGSTPFQILDGDIPIMLYYRDYKTDEQAYRAGLLSEHPGVQLVERVDVERGDLADRIEKALLAPRLRRETGYDFNGVQTAAELLAELLAK